MRFLKKTKYLLDLSNFYSKIEKLKKNPQKVILSRGIFMRECLKYLHLNGRNACKKLKTN